MENGFSLIELFNLGGPFMWILLAFSVVTVAIIIERIIYISWHDRKVIPLGNEIMNLLDDGKKEDAEKADLSFPAWRSGHVQLLR